MTEVEGRLAQSLHNAVWLTLGMERQDYRVQRPWSATIVQEQQSGEVLETGTRIIEVFDRPELNRQLLILGEPGAGKTTMMLELAQNLLQLAKINKAEPIPVLISLSAWKNPKQSIFEWLLGELKSKYGLSQALATQWLKKHQLLPLLDGLDEVAPQYQKACASALNTWLLGDLVEQPCGVLICCRREEFEQVVQQPLSLYGAIYLRPLTVEQIETYFAQFELQDVWQTVHQDAPLQELITKPLFLSMFGLVASQKKFSIDDWQARTTSERKIEYLLDTYWEATIERELIFDPIERQRGILSKTYGTKPLPTRQAVLRSLVFAAKMLNRDFSTELLIEKIQPAALLTRRQQWSYHLIVGASGGLIIGLIGSPILQLIFGITLELIGSLIVGGLISGLTFGLIFRIDRITPVEKISISTSQGALREILYSLCLGLSVGLMIGLIIGLILTLIVEPMDGLIGGLIVGLIFGLIGGLIRGLKADVQTRLEPNQGIKNSIRNMLIASTLSLLVVLPLKFLLELLFASVVDPEILSMIIAASLYFLVWSSFDQGGGDAFIKHLALRIVLFWNHYAPFRYDLLLNYCTERLLLQRIGGRYRFMHKLLQDHFAKMDL